MKNRIVRILITVAFSLMATAAYAQNSFKVSLKLVDANTNEPAAPRQSRRDPSRKR